MRHTFVLALLLGSLSACGPTLMRTSKGWHDDAAPYYIKPSAQGSLLSGQWSLVSHERKGDGYKAIGLAEYESDLEFTRVEDDGILVVVSEPLRQGDVGKLASVLADRWLERIVTKPGGEDYALYEALVPPLVSTAHIDGPSILSANATAVSGRNASITRREDFKVSGGSATELVANLVPGDAPGPDRTLYLAVFKHAYKAEIVVVGYANTPNMFERGLPDAVDLAHRISFQ